MIEYAKNPVQNSNGTIDLIVKFSQFPEELPFTASPDDPEEHGRFLYAEAIKGTYGIIQT